MFLKVILLISLLVFVSTIPTMNYGYETILESAKLYDGIYPISEIIDGQEESGFLVNDKGNIPQVFGSDIYVEPYGQTYDDFYAPGQGGFLPQTSFDSDPPAYGISMKAKQSLGGSGNNNLKNKTRQFWPSL